MARLPTGRPREKKVPSTTALDSRKVIAGRLKGGELTKQRADDQPFDDTDSSKVRLLAAEDILPAKFSFDDLEDNSDRYYFHDRKEIYTYRRNFPGDSSALSERSIKDDLFRYVEDLEESEWIHDKTNYIGQHHSK